MPCAQQPARLRACRFYAGEMAMSALALAAAFYGIASVNKWSFSVFLTLQGTPKPSAVRECAPLDCMHRIALVRLTSLVGPCATPEPCACHVA